MKRTLAALTITALALTGGAVALDAQRGQGNGNGPGAGQRRAAVGAQGPQRGPGFQMGQGFRRGGPGGPGRPGGPGARLRGLDLTEDQKAQVKALHERLRQDIEAVLTPEQQAKLKARGGGRGGRGGRGGGTE